MEFDCVVYYVNKKKICMNESVNDNEVHGSTVRRLEIAPGVVLARSAMTITAVRSSGPGGQNVNKRSTKVRLSVDISAIKEITGDAACKRLVLLAGRSNVTEDGRLLIVCDEKRSQISNRKRCFERLRLLVIESRKRPRVRKRTVPTKGSIERRLDSKKHRSDIKAQRKRPSNDG